MDIQQYFSPDSTDQDSFSFTREQASAFAKDVAGDFNPLHDVETKRFCVPGDLLFSIALAKLGVSQRMHFTFTGMVVEGVTIGFSSMDDDELNVVGDNDKEYLSIKRSGELSKDAELATSLAERYVEFSGHTFPHILVPLMEQKNVMIHPTRPLVIYESMSIDLLRLDFVNSELEITETTLEVNGKRGCAFLKFCFKVDGEIVGYGEKRMALSGLREFDATVISGLINHYDQRKSQYIG